MSCERSAISMMYARGVTPAICAGAARSARTKIRVVGLAGILVAVSTSLIVVPALFSASPVDTGAPPPPPRKPPGGAVPLGPSLGAPESPAAWPRPGNDPDGRRAALLSASPADTGAPPPPRKPHGGAVPIVPSLGAPESPAAWPRPGNDPDVRRAVPRADIEGLTSLYSVRATTDEGLKGLTSLYSVTAYSVSAKHDDELKEAMVHLPEGLTNLSINVRYSSVTDEGLKALAAHLPQGLTRFDIDLAEAHITDEGLKALAARLPGGLTSLRVCLLLTNVADEGLKALAAHLPQGLTRFDIHLAGTQIADEGLKALAAHLPQGLTSFFIQLASTQIADEGLKALAAHLPQGLTRFDISLAEAHITDEGLKALAAHIPQGLTSLAIILYKNTKVTDEVLKALVRHLPKGLRSFTLDLDGTLVADDAARALGLFVSGAHGLQDVHVIFPGRSVVDELPLPTATTGMANQFVDAAFEASIEMRALAGALPSEKQVLDLNYSHWNVSDKGIMALANKLPKGFTHFAIDLRGTSVANDGVSALGFAVLDMRSLDSLLVYLPDGSRVASLPWSRDTLHRTPGMYARRGSMAEAFLIAAGEPSWLQKAILTVRDMRTRQTVGFATAVALAIIGCKHAARRKMGVEDNDAPDDSPHIGWRIAASKVIFRKKHGRMAELLHVADAIEVVCLFGPAAYILGMYIVMPVYALFYLLPALVIHGCMRVVFDPSFSISTHAERTATRLLFGLRGVAVPLLVVLLWAQPLGSGCDHSGHCHDPPRGIPVEAQLAARVRTEIDVKAPNDVLVTLTTWLNPYRADIFADVNTFQLFHVFNLVVLHLTVMAGFFRLLAALVQLSTAFVVGSAAADTVSESGNDAAGSGDLEALLPDSAAADSVIKCGCATAESINLEDEAQQLATRMMQGDCADFDKSNFWTFFWMFADVLPVLADFAFDLNTTIGMFYNENFKFAGFLTMVWLVSLAEEIYRGPLLHIRSEVQESLESGMTSKRLTEMCVRETGWEAFLSLAVTSYGVPFCFVNELTMGIGFFSMLLSIKGIAKHLHIRVNLKVDVD